MICDRCQGTGYHNIRQKGRPLWHWPCPDCGGYGQRHCCDGDQPSDHDRNIEQERDNGQRG